MKRENFPLNLELISSLFLPKPDGSQTSKHFFTNHLQLTVNVFFSKENDERSVGDFSKTMVVLGF